MSSWGKLLSQYRYILGIGFLFTYFSSFGQTFLISLYVPHIESWLGLSNTAMSGIYAIATVASAFSLPYMGGLFDRLSLGRYMSLILSGLVLALLTLAFSFHIIVVVLGLYFLRLFGLLLLLFLPWDLRILLSFSFSSSLVQPKGGVPPGCLLP